ncbi:fasciclin-like arabinogalactan protein 10 [Dorcoceras hygrometricum]|uniref:Fasciclin-like arabinogalactan protein 10 n=1 Tax=Dorcoceras hygrometricum TaxID=472368 RepID=A0A2Z7AWN5_9LAMI|nr:fasciclin-like arabinogalactan protein 10 [Dorcoceras hygrometricum]
MAAFLLSFVAITILASASANTNITEILDAYPEYKEFNDLLSQTKLADEINSRRVVTVCVLPNGGLSSYTGKYPLSVIKNILSLHVLLDYFDVPKLHKISDGSILSTTLYQTTGNANGKLGFVNITVLRGGKIGFGSGIPGSPLDCTLTKSVKQVEYNVSVIEVSQAIAPAEILAAAPPAADVNITDLLVKAGCNSFASYIVSTGVLKVYESAVNNGLTIFAPNDEAFKADNAPDLSTLSNAELVSILQYHALASYFPIGTLKETKDKITTLATNGAGKYALGVKTEGDSVSLETGVDTSRIASTVLDSTPLCIFTVDNLLLPVELFGKPPSPAPAPEPETSPSPSPAADAPAPESAAAPAPVLSPPAPPTSSPRDAPSEGPTADSQNSTSGNSAGVLEAPALMRMVLTVAVSYLRVFCCPKLSFSMFACIT